MPRFAGAPACASPAHNAWTEAVGMPARKVSTPRAKSRRSYTRRMVASSGRPSSKRRVPNFVTTVSGVRIDAGTLAAYFAGSVACVETNAAGTTTHKVHNERRNRIDAAPLEDCASLWAAMRVQGAERAAPWCSDGSIRTPSFPLDRGRRLAADVVHHARHAAQLVDDPVRHQAEE